MKTLKEIIKELGYMYDTIEDEKEAIKLAEYYANERVKEALQEAADNAQVLSWGQPVFSQSLTVDKESILSLIKK